MLGLNALSSSRQVSLKGYMIICSLFSLLPASPRPSWRGADTPKPGQDFLSSSHAFWQPVPPALSPPPPFPEKQWPKAPSCLLFWIPQRKSRVEDRIPRGPCCIPALAAACRPWLCHPRTFSTNRQCHAMLGEANGL